MQNETAQKCIPRYLDQAFWVVEGEQLFFVKNSKMEHPDNSIDESDEEICEIDINPLQGKIEMRKKKRRKAKKYPEQKWKRAELRKSARIRVEENGGAESRKLRATDRFISVVEHYQHNRMALNMTIASEGFSVRKEYEREVPFADGTPVDREYTGLVCEMVTPTNVGDAPEFLVGAIFFKKNLLSFILFIFYRSSMKMVIALMCLWMS